MQPNEKNLDMENEEIQTEPDDTIASLEDKLQAMEKERDDYLDMAQRMKAEFENFKRRNSAVRSEAYEDGTREIVTQILPVIDNLERALDAAGEKTPLSEGVELVYKQLMETLEKRGMSVIDRVGEPFDPELENAVMQVEGEGQEPGTVATVMQKGYMLKDRVIRYAMVQVVAQ